MFNFFNIYYWRFFCSFLFSRDGRLLIGDEIVNVNGRRLRGLSMPEAKAILRGCSKKDVDIVVARNISISGGVAKPPLPELLPGSGGGEAQQPLSLLAHHDEHDLINLSSMPLRPGGEMEDGDAEDEEEFE